MSLPFAMRVRAALTLWLAAAGVAVVACSSFGSGDAPATDAGTDTAEDVITADGAVDASVNDASCARYCNCQNNAAFCADFDTATLLGEWDKTVASDGSVLGAAPSDRSPPNALVLSTPASSDGTGASVRKTVSGNIANLSLSFDVDSSMLSMPTDAGASAELVLVSGFDGPAPKGDLQLVRTPLGPKLLIPGGATESTDLPAFPNTRQWVRVHIEVKAGVATVHYDDGPIVAAGAPFPATSTLVVVRLGLTNTGASAVSRLAYDNVVLRFE